MVFKSIISHKRPLTNLFATEMSIIQNVIESLQLVICNQFNLLR